MNKNSKLLLLKQKLKNTEWQRKESLCLNATTVEELDKQIKGLKQEIRWLENEVKNAK